MPEIPHNVTRKRVHSRARKQKSSSSPQKPLGARLSNLFDSLVLVAAELLKSFVREILMLVEKFLNGAAAAMLHLTFQPGYIAQRRERLQSTSRQEETNIQTSSRFAKLWQSMNGSPSAQNSSNDLSTNSTGTDRPTPVITSTEEDHISPSIVRTMFWGFIVRLESIHRLIAPNLPNPSDVFAKFGFGSPRNTHTPESHALHNVSSGSTPGNLNGRHDNNADQPAIYRDSPLARRSRAHTEREAVPWKRVQPSSGLLEDLSIQIQVIVDKMGRYVRSFAHRLFTRGAFAFIKSRNKAIIHRASFKERDRRLLETLSNRYWLIWWPLSWLELFWQLLLFLGKSLIKAVCYPFVFINSLRHSDDPLHTARSVYRRCRTIVSITSTICKEVMARIFATSQVLWFRRKAKSLNYRYGHSNHIRSRDLPASKAITGSVDPQSELLGYASDNERSSGHRSREYATYMKNNQESAHSTDSVDQPAVAETRVRPLRHRASSLESVEFGNDDAQKDRGLARPLSPLRGMAVRLIDEVFGFPVQTFSVQTADGYLLRLIRIPRPESNRVAFFQHGLLDTAMAWVANGHLFSLACRAYQMGFDVFLGNLRGTTDLQAHEIPRERRRVTRKSKQMNHRHTKHDRKSSATQDELHVIEQHKRNLAALPAHVSLDVHDLDFWSYSVDDHVLDVFALTDKMMELKEDERDAWVAHLHKERSWRRSKQHDREQPIKEELYTVGIGHSMGGCLMLANILHSRALRRKHGFDKLVLLSPAGYHKIVAPPAKIALLAIHWLLDVGPDGPFPMRSSLIEKAFAKLLQDLKRTQATSDALASLMAVVFGGTGQNMAFRHVHFTQYPLGGSCRRVFRHGIQCMKAREWTPFNFGKKENTRRYGVHPPPSYRADYGLLDVPVHFVAGGKDYLIPPENLLIQNDAINLVHPGLSTVRVFPDAGHLDFTLGLDDDVIAHVLREIDRVSNTPAKKVVATATESSTCNGNSSDTSNHPRNIPTSPVTEMTDITPVTETAMLKNHSGVDPDTWLPARECARQYPWLFCFTKLEKAFDGLDKAANMKEIKKLQRANQRKNRQMQNST